MHKAQATIRKVGNQFCVFSKTGKNLGCSTTRQGAVKRLRQVEFFKRNSNKGSTDMNMYDEAFENFAQALHKGFNPQDVGNEPTSAPRQVDISSETLNTANTMGVGSIAGYKSDRLLDTKDHFPVVTHAQAQSSMARVMQLTEVPGWYNGDLSQLRQDVYAGIMSMHPDIELNVRVPVEQVVALSDGETPAETSISDVQDPEDDRTKDMVPEVARPTLTSAQVEAALNDEETRRAVGGKLMEMIDKQIQHMQAAKKLGERLMKSGLKAEEFDQLSTFIQEDILRELMSRGVSASMQDRRRELLDRMQQND